jgi:intracellular multiplication protein IcmN
MSKLRNYYCLLFVFGMALLITSCTSSLWDGHPPPRPTTAGAIIGTAGGLAIAGTPIGAAIGGVWGAAIGGIIASKQTLVDNLIYNGVQVIQVGDEVEIILPSNKFFFPDSANLNPTYGPILDKVAELIRSFDKVNVKVAAYRDNSDPWQRSLALSKLQAKKVANYLWKRGIDARLLYAIGYGQEMPIASNDTLKGRTMNRRVEITLRKVQEAPLI